MDEVGGVDSSVVYRLEPRIYLIRLAGHLTVDASNRLSELIQKDCGGKHAVIYETTRDFTGYDPRLRQRPKNPALSGMAHIGVITSSPLLRIVTAAVAVGLRVTTGVPMAAYGSVEHALDGARLALAKG